MTIEDAVRGEVLSSAMKHGLVEGPDLVVVPEIIGLPPKMSAQVVSDLVDYHARRGQQIQLPMVQRGYCYIFAKGMEAAYLWQQSPDGHANILYSAADWLSGRVGARVSRDFQSTINRLIPRMEDSFLDIQAWLKANQREVIGTQDGQLMWLLGCVGVSGLIGVHCGMKALGY